MNFSMIRYVIGLVMLFESAFLSLPCLIALIYHEKKGFSFWIMLFVCLIIGILFVMKKPKKTVYYAKEGFLTVAISWIVMSFFGALPFVISGSQTLQENEEETPIIVPSIMSVLLSILGIVYKVKSRGL